MMGRLQTLKPRVASQPAPRIKTFTTATVRTRGWAWEQIRKRIFTRDCGLCQPSLRRGLTVPATEVDHIVPLAQGGTDADSNLQSISSEPHKAKTAAELTGGTWDEKAWFAGR